MFHGIIIKDYRRRSNREKKLKITRQEATMSKEIYTVRGPLLEHFCIEKRRFIIQRIRSGFHPQKGIRKANKIERAGENFSLKTGD